MTNWSSQPFRQLTGVGIAKAALLATFFAAILLTAAVVSRGQGERGARATLSPEDIARQFCVPLIPEAQVGPEDVPDRVAIVVVPDVRPTAISTPLSLSVRKGDVVKVIARSPVAGAVGVHGLSTIEVVQSGGSVEIKFRAIYSGRFPLHFHGIDGAHFEIMTINVNSE